jgi:membrane-associated HD superfamily phosphohydrolase
MYALLVYGSFLAATWYLTKTLATTEGGLVRLAIPAGLTLLFLLVSDAFTPPLKRKNSEWLLSLIVRTSLVALCSVVGLLTDANFYGFILSMILVSTAKLMYEAGAAQPQGAGGSALLAGRESRPLSRTVRVTMILINLTSNLFDVLVDAEQNRSQAMKSKMRKIVFFVVLIVVAVSLALAVGDKTDRSKTKATYSEFLQQVQAGEVSKATIAVAKTGATPVTYRLKSGSEWLTIIPRNYQEALAAMQTRMVNVEIRDLTSQRLSVFLNASPFFLLLGVWVLMMIRMKKSPNGPRMFQE